jgi:hypothetical protein
MRVAELLDALSKGYGGVQVNLTKERVTISTRYRPRITRSGDTLLEVAIEVGIAVLEYHEKQMNTPQEVVEALYAYNRHTLLL